MDDDRARELLTTERERIERALAGLGRQDAGDLSDAEEPGDAGSDLYQDELDEGRADDLREQRVADGTYGLSTESGRPIPDERLEARPTAELTADEERARRG